MPQRSWHVTKRDHQGSTRDEILNEPEWNGGGQHRIGYRNNAGRIPGITHPCDELSLEDEEAWKEVQELRQKIEKGALVNFRDLIEHQKVRTRARWYFEDALVYRA